MIDTAYLKGKEYYNKLIIQVCFVSCNDVVSTGLKTVTYTILFFQYAPAHKLYSGKYTQYTYIVYIIKNGQYLILMNDKCTRWKQINR